VATRRQEHTVTPKDLVMSEDQETKTPEQLLTASEETVNLLTSEKQELDQEINTLKESVNNLEDKITELVDALQATKNDLSLAKEEHKAITSKLFVFLSQIQSSTNLKGVREVIGVELKERITKIQKFTNTALSLV
jgi:predicted  nucleic acid-binding Zn-ribbon protein